MSRMSWLTTLLMAGRLIQRLLVLNTLNFFTDMKSSSLSCGTCATSSSRSLPSYWIRVPPCKQEEKYFNSFCCVKNICSQQKYLHPYLDVCPSFLCDLHDELLSGGEALVEDVEVDGGADVVHVGDEAELLGLGQEPVQQPAVGEGCVEVAVAGRIPVLLGGLRNHTAPEDRYITSAFST